MRQDAHYLDLIGDIVLKSIELIVLPEGILLRTGGD